jgi:ABC-type multidrug transport system fused ATPase/permease subunit
VVSKKLLGFRRGLLSWTDKRVGLMNEVINGMQMIKFYAWERSFRADIMAARNNEARILKAMVWWQGLFAMLLFSGPVAMAVFCFASYAAAGNVFSAAQAYTALALFNLLRLPLAFLPMMITSLVNAMVALQRISDFLRKPEAGTAALREAAKDLAPGTVQVRGMSGWVGGFGACNLGGRCMGSCKPMSPSVAVRLFAYHQEMQC